MRWWVVVIAVAFCHGCIDHDLVPCGDRYCPVDSTCMAGRCIDPQQRVACDGVAEGDGCIVLETAGVCHAGLCEIAGRCGDGFVDTGEVCDDGNQADGDGCSRTCASDETCGNGVLDAAETCDCGNDATTQPLGCPTTNSDDISALCDTQCTRLCGDNRVTGLEACDGTEVPATCEDFGFYTGTVTCSPFCSFVRDCSGQCGDSIVDATDGEVCDGDATVTDTCVAFGRDYGVLGCNEFCNPDVGGDCGFYEWSLLATVGELTDAQANDHGYALNGAGTIEVSYDGTVTTVSRTTTTRLFATTDTFLLSDASAGQLALERFDPGIGWVPLSSLPTQVGATFQAMGDGPNLFVLDEDTCEVIVVDIFDQTEEKLPTPPGSGCKSFDVLDGEVVISNGNAIYWFDGASWVEVSRQVDSVHWFGDHIVGLRNGVRDIFDRMTGDQVVALPLSNVTHIVTTRGGNDVALTDVRAVIAHVGYLGGFISTPSGIQTIKRDGAGHVLAWGDKLVAQLAAAWTVPDLQRSFTEQPDGSFVHFTSSTVATSSWPGGFGQPTSAVGPADKPTLVATTNGVYSFDIDSSTYVLDGGLSGSSLLVASKTEIWAVVAGVPQLRNGTSWNAKPLPSGCTSTIDAAATKERVLFLFVCPSTFGSRRVFEMKAAGWTQIGPLITGDNLVVAREDDTIFVASMAQIRRLDNNETSWSTVGAVFDGGSIAARSADEIYYGRAQDNSLYLRTGAREIPFRQLSPLPMSVQQAVTLDAGLYVKTSQGNAVLGWFGAKPAGL